MQKKIEKICNQEIEVMTANETRHQTHYIFTHLELGWLVSLREGHTFLKSLDDNTLKRTYKDDSPDSSSSFTFQKSWFQGLDSNLMFSKFLNLLSWDTWKRNSTCALCSYWHWTPSFPNTELPSLPKKGVKIAIHDSPNYQPT